jgi:hypothetical protein
MLASILYIFADPLVVPFPTILNKGYQNNAMIRQTKLGKDQYNRCRSKWNHYVAHNLELTNRLTMKRNTIDICCRRIVCRICRFPKKKTKCDGHRFRVVVCVYFSFFQKKRSFLLRILTLSAISYC